MKRKNYFSKGTYLLLSMGIATIMIYSALPYYSMTSITIPGANIFWGYAEIQKKMLLLFPTLSFLGAVTTIRARKTVEDVFLNVALPLNVLLVLKSLQYKPWFTIIVISVLLVVVFPNEITRVLSGDWNTAKKRRRCRFIYYKWRKTIIYSTLFVFAPVAVCVNFQEDTREERIIYESKTEEEEERDAEAEDAPIRLVTQDEWDAYTVEERFEELERFTKFQSEKLGVGDVDVYAIKELTADDTLAYYSYEDDAIYYNVVFLVDCTLREALHVACHEAFHKYQQAVLDTLTVLEEAEIDYESLEYFSEALDMREASDSYEIDSLSFDTYTQNLLEVTAEEYAKQEVIELEEKGYF